MILLFHIRLLFQFTTTSLCRDIVMKTFFRVWKSTFLWKYNYFVTFTTVCNFLNWFNIVYISQIAYNLSGDIMENVSNKDIFSKALIELSKETKIKNINVIDIVEKSELSRQTFYRNFYNIDDLIYYIHKKNVEPAHLAMERLNNSSSLSDLYINLMDSNRNFYKQIISFNPNSAFVDRYIIETKKNMLIYTFNQNSQEILNNKVLYFDYNFYCIGYCICLLQWLKDDKNLSAKEISESFKNLVPKSLFRFIKK